MGVLNLGQTVMRRLHVRSFRSHGSHGAQNEARPQGLTAKGYANLAVLCAPFYYWVLYRLDFGGIRTLMRGNRAFEEEWKRKCSSAARNKKVDIVLPSR